MKNILFEWDAFTEEDLAEINSLKGSERPETEIYGFIYITANGKLYIVDVRYDYYDSKDQGFCLELYRSDEYRHHITWLGGCKSIKSAKNYKRFKKRAEQLLANRINYIKPGDKVVTPRFCTVQIKEVFDTQEEAEKAGYTELADFDDPEFGVSGKSLNMRHMVFAAYRR